MVKWDNTGIANVPGEIAILAGLLMWATTFPRIRRKMFELFFYTHQLYIAFLFFYMLHVGVSHICVILPGVYLFMVDRYLRFLQSRAKVRLVSARLLPSESMELNFAKSPGLAFEPLSVVFINVPGVSSLQWHPFTVSSSSNLEPERLSVIIKKEGSWTQKLYGTLSSPVPQDRLDVSVEGPYAFVTREKSSTDDAPNNIRTIWFKPFPSDVPIAPVLGPNGWLWLAAIVSSSFVAFLLLIGILQRYYIYPIDHNTNKVFSYSSRSVLNLLFICICIMAAASAAVLWNKRDNPKQEKQIQNVDAPTPTTSPGSRFYNADRELESVPQDSLVKATMVEEAEQCFVEAHKRAEVETFELVLDLGLALYHAEEAKA
ncbi:hypothetical protein BHE74_00057215 [Ensete ventricosum]|nr:hypothetical protein BHE74_00057215 [Ensete ventricosum]